MFGRRILRSAWLAGLAVVTLIASGAPAGSADAPPPESAGTSASPASVTVGLITGDRVAVGGDPEQPAVTVDPAPRQGPDPVFQVFTYDSQVYVVPSDAGRLVPDVLDMELFNVTKLVEYGYTDDELPVIIDPAQSRAATATTSDGLAVTAELESIGAVAASVDTGDGAWWAAVTAAPAATSRAAAATAPAGVDKVWLDARVEASLDVSVPLTQAPQAWEAGYDGSGTTVAVLDTGVDATHPDLAGSVVAAANFTDASSATDRHGHGTHVAGTIAGSGAAADGRYRGVAPGAELLNVKVLNDVGSGQFSWIIDGMEWAAEQGADVISMSLGDGQPSDGTDPMSQAVDALTAAHDVLFVIAAGNEGSGDGTVASPGAAASALTVGAVDKSGVLAEFSSRGPRVGDYGIKPDVTAPGVAIAAARASGTAIGTVVDETYTRLSGTSMATPHVAGAAAIVRQRSPELGPAEVKAALIGTARPNPGADAFQQGTGLIDVAAAIESSIQASPSSIDVGRFEYPHVDPAPRTRTVTYTNSGDTAVTLDLAVDVRLRNGGPAPASMVTVEPATLTIEPGGTAAAAVTVDVHDGELGLYSGYLTATSAAGAVTHTAIGFYKEPEVYDLTIKGIARDGRPATLDSVVNVLDVHSLGRYLRPITYFGPTGEVTLRVPPSTYAVMGSIYTYDASYREVQESVFVGDPEIEVSGDTTVVFDARDARPVTLETPEHPDSVPVDQGAFNYWRFTEFTGPFGVTWPTEASWELFTLPTEPVTIGQFEFAMRWQYGPRTVEVEVAEPVTRRLGATLMFRSPPVDGTHTLRLVDAGEGDPDDFDGLDVDGAVVLVRRSELSYSEVEARAAAAGAAALVIANSAPGEISSWLGPQARIPTATVPEADGDLLLDLLAEGEVQLRLTGTATPEYLYDLVVPVPGGVIPHGFHHVADTAELATVEVAFHKGVADATLTETRHVSRPYYATYSYHYPVHRPYVRTDYRSTGDVAGYARGVHVWNGEDAAELTQLTTYYTAGPQEREDWYRAVLRPGVYAPEAPRRTGDTLQLWLMEWADAAGHIGWGVNGVDTSAFRLYRDGTLVAEEPRPQGSFPLSAEPAEYRLELDVTREADGWVTSTGTRTAWTVRSQRPADDGTEVLPLLLLDYATDVDLSNTAPDPIGRRGPNTVEVRVTHQPGATGSAIRGAELSISFDDGATWRPVRGRSLGSGRYEFVLPGRHPLDARHLSLRAEGWDAEGNRIEQEVIRAWQLVALRAG